MSKTNELKIEYKDGEISITVGVETFYNVIKNDFLYGEYNSDGIVMGIENIDEFGKEVVRELENELGDDGTTEVHKLFDTIFNKIVENGGTGLVMREEK